MFAHARSNASPVSFETRGTPNWKSSHLLLGFAVLLTIIKRSLPSISLTCSSHRDQRGWRLVNSGITNNPGWFDWSPYRRGGCRLVLASILGADSPRCHSANSLLVEVAPVYDNPGETTILAAAEVAHSLMTLMIDQPVAT
jgi:hypothetical protein